MSVLPFVYIRSTTLASPAFLAGVVLLLLYIYCCLQLLMLRCCRKKDHLLRGLSHVFCSTIASFLIRSWVGAHAFFAARKKNYGHAQRRRKHCRSFSEFPCTYTSVTTYIPLPLWLFPGIRVCTVRRFVASLYFYVFVRQLCCFDFFAHLNNRRTPTLCAPRA